MRLKERVAIVTGGSSGIGREIAFRFAKEGAKVAIVNRKAENGRAVSREITEAGGVAASFPCDVSVKGEVQSTVDAVLDTFGTVDILMANAGVMINKSVEEFSEAEWDQVIDINLKGNLFLVQSVVPVMKKKRYGKIILIGSIAGSLGYANGVAYCVSKGGILMMMKALTAELAKDSINVNCLSPGATATPLNQAFRDDPEVLALFAKNTPTGRHFVPPGDMAGAALFLASDDANAVHGLNLLVDDGFSAVKPV